jgi:hypothetical protein
VRYREDRLQQLSYVTARRSEMILLTTLTVAIVGTAAVTVAAVLAAIGFVHHLPLAAGSPAITFGLSAFTLVVAMRDLRTRYSLREDRETLIDQFQRSREELLEVQSPPREIFLPDEKLWSNLVWQYMGASIEALSRIDPTLNLSQPPHEILEGYREQLFVAWYRQVEAALLHEQGFQQSRRNLPLAH